MEFRVAAALFLLGWLTSMVSYIMDGGRKLGTVVWLGWHWPQHLIAISLEALWPHIFNVEVTDDALDSRR